VEPVAPGRGGRAWSELEELASPQHGLEDYLISSAFHQSALGALVVITLRTQARNKVGSPAAGCAAARLPEENGEASQDA